MSGSNTPASPDPAAQAAAIRTGLAKIAALSDAELVQRDAAIKALFHAVSTSATFTLAGFRNFDQLTQILLGFTIPG